MYSYDCETPCKIFNCQKKIRTFEFGLHIRLFYSTLSNIGVDREVKMVPL